MSEFTLNIERPIADDAEDAVISAIIRSRAACDEALETIRPDAFAKGINRTIFEAAGALRGAGVLPGKDAILSRLREDGIIKSSGSDFERHLERCHNRRVKPMNVSHYAERVRTAQHKRSLLDAVEEVVRLVQSGKGEMQSEAERLILRAAMTMGTSSLRHIGEVMEETEEFVRKAAEMQGLTGVPTGIQTLDDITGGWQAGDLILVAARPSMGKSAFAGTSITNAAREGYGQQINSLEMPNKQYVLRMTAQQGKFDVHAARMGNMKDLTPFDVAAQELSELPVWLDDTSGMTLQHVRSNARRAVRDFGATCIWTDYMQLMDATGEHGSNRNEQVGQISRGLKDLAKDLDVPIIALAQLSRRLESRSDMRPRLSDLRDSGELEQDADVVVFIYRDEQYGIQVDEAGRDTEGIAELIVAKQRNGPTDTARVAFVKQYAMFADLHNHPEEACVF